MTKDANLHGYTPDTQVHNAQIAKLEYQLVDIVRRGEHDHVIDKCTQLIALDAQNITAYYNRGFAYSNKNAYEDALADYTHVIRLDAYHAAAYNNRGVIYGQEGAYQKAIADFTRAIEIKPQDAQAYANRGVVFAKNNSYTSAITDFTHAIQLNPDDVRTYYRRAIAYGQQGDKERMHENYDLAICDLTHVIQSEPQNSYAYHKRANLYGQKGDHVNAIKDYTYAIKLRPQNLHAYNNRGFSYMLNSQHDNAIDDFVQAITINSEYSNAYYGRGLAYLGKGDDKHAIQNFQKVLQLHFIQNEGQLVPKQYVARYHPADMQCLTALYHQKLWLANPNDFNDPFDSKIIQKYLTKNIPLHRAIESVRIAAFEHDADHVSDIDVLGMNTALWAYYADSHRGFCAIYELHEGQMSDKILWRHVQYPETITPHFDDFSHFFDSAFVQKLTDWRHEREARLLYYDPDIISGGILLSEAEVGIRLRRIYFGYAMPDEIRLMLAETLNSKRKTDQVAFFTIKENDVNPFKLERNHYTIA